MERSQLVTLIDAELERRVASVIDGLPEAEPLVAEIARLIKAGGKRLRPLFCYWGFRVSGAHCREIVTSSSALELLHTFALIHDDIMDGSLLRRGEATVNSRHGNDFALLAGDLALVVADDVFISAGWDDNTVRRGFSPYSRMRQEVIAGQYLDLAASQGVSLTRDEARTIAVLKSGRYSIEMPMIIGATLAGAGPELLEALSAVGAPLGEAFQLRDDLLGTFGEQGVTGKSSESDIRSGKRNFLFAAASSRLEGADRSFLLERWGGGADLDEDTVERLRALIEASGARAEVEALLEDLSQKARAALEAIDMPDEVRAALELLAHDAVERIS